MFIKKSRIICLITVFILLLSVLPLVNNNLTATGDISEYQQVINSLYELKENNLMPETFNQRYNSQYDYNSLPLTHNQPQTEDHRVMQSISSEWFSQLVVTFDISHAPTNMHEQAASLGDSLLSAGATFNLIEEAFEIPADTNVLLIPSSTAAYSGDEFIMINDWFYSEGPHLIWTAGDNDFRGFYSPEPNNGILEMLGSNLRLSADAVDDLANNDSWSFMVAVQTPVKDGELNARFTEGVESAIFHGPTSVLGYNQFGVVDLRGGGIEGIEVIMQSSGDATAMDLDGSLTEFDYYSIPGVDTGSYPMIAIQDMSENKFVIASGEVIYSDFGSQYSYSTQMGVWNEGVHEGKLLVDNILSWFSYVVESEVPQPEPQLRVAFDVSHNPTVHWNAYMLEEALSSVDVEFRKLWNINELSEDVDVLLIPSSTMMYGGSELNHIAYWFESAGDKLLWVAGDSDWSNFYSPEANNGILAMLDSSLRLSADTVQDNVSNDGRPHRVAVPIPVSGGDYNSILTEGVSSAIFHGPASVLGYKEESKSIVDLTVEPLEGVEIIIQASQDAQALNWDGSTTEFDFYSLNQPFGGNYTMMAIDSHFGDGKHVIVSGEPIFTDYKNMYGVHTERGLIGDPSAWNGGVHDGKILVDNIFNWVGLDPALPRNYGHAPIYIEGDDEFASYGFPGSGTDNDPYRIEGFSFASWADNLITISGTSAYFNLTDNLFDGSYSGFNAIQLFDVRNGKIERNRIKNSFFGYYLGNSQDVLFRQNELYGNEFGIYLENTAGRAVCARNTLYGNNEGISIFNDPPVVNIWPGELVEVTDSESIAWQFTFGSKSVDFTQTLHGWWNVDFTLDGNPVDVEKTDPYFDEWDTDRPYKFDFKYFTDPLPLGDYVFLAQFFKEEVYRFNLTMYVTVVPTPFSRNILFQNELFDNNNGIHLQNADNDLLVGNIIMGSFQEGIGVYGSSNNLIRFNQIGYSGMKGIMVAHDFGWGTVSENNEIWRNTVYGGNEDGISLEWANNNLVTENEIFDNQWAGIRLFGTSKYNDIIGNTVHDNWGGGIAFESYSNVHMRFWQDITATEADHISWQISFLNESDERAWYKRNNMEVLLTIDGEPVNVWFSEVYEVYFDDDQRLYRFDVDSYLEPLPEGKHEFNVQCTLEGEIIREKTAYVTVIPATIEDYTSYNYLSNNDISENGWGGIILGNTFSNTISNNQIRNNWGTGIEVFGSYNLISENTIEENEFEGIRLSGDYGSGTSVEYNTIESNIICRNGQTGINLAIANHNFVANNDISEHPEVGVGLGGTSSNNIIEGNTIYNNWNGIQISGTASENTIANNVIHNNWETGISLNSYSEVHMRLWQDITATEADSIFWQASFIESLIDPEYGGIDYVYDHLVTELTIDGELVEVWDSGLGIYYDEGWQQLRFDIDYYTDPLPEGDHIFHTQFFLDDVPIEEWTRTAIVTVIPATDDDYVSNNNIVNNDILENGWCGINIWRANSNLIDMNRISNNGAQGIWIGESRSNEILNNLVEFSGADSGINLYHCRNHVVSGNTVTYNGFGILLEESDNNVIIGNTVIDNYETGIQLMGTSSGNTIMDNVVIRSGAHGIAIDSYSEVQIRFWESVTATEADYILWYHTWRKDSPKTAQQFHDSLGIYLTVDDGEPVEVWTSDVYEDGDKWVFDMNYHSEPLIVGIHNFTVKFSLNGEEWFELTAQVTVFPATDENYASHNTIISNKIFNTQKWMGISLFRSHYNYIEGNIIGSATAGIRLEGSMYNTITSNKAFGCINGGVMLIRSSDYNLVTENVLFRHGWSGMFVGFSSFNEITNNTLYENARNGISTFQSNSNEFMCNNIFANPIGISLTSSSDSIITRNILNSNAFAGIYLVGGSSGNMISRNNVSDSGYAGIVVLGGSNDNNILRNTVNDCYFGILLDSTSFNNVYRNIVFSNVEGICLSYSSSNQVSRNIVVSNVIGIHLVESSDNKLFRNIFFGNGWDILEEP